MAGIGRLRRQQVQAQRLQSLGYFAGFGVSDQARVEEGCKCPLIEALANYHHLLTPVSNQTGGTSIALIHRFPDTARLKPQMVAWVTWAKGERERRQMKEGAENEDGKAEESESESESESEEEVDHEEEEEE